MWLRERGRRQGFFDILAGGIKTLGDIWDHAEADSMSIDKSVKELSKENELARVSGRMFEQEHLLVHQLEQGGDHVRLGRHRRHKVQQRGH